MKAGIFRIALFLALSSVAVSVYAQRFDRIRFAKGATNAVVSGSLSGYSDSKTYVIHVRRGQKLTTAQIGDRHNITIYIRDPKGNDPTDSDASCNNRREINPTIAGDYKLEVVQCQKADEWRGYFRFRVTVR